MSTSPSSKAQERWESSDGSADWLQLVQPNGNIIGWIDPLGVPSGALASGGGGALLQSTVSISSAQILSLSTTPVTLIPAPGAGKYICPISVSIQLNFNTTAYTITGVDGLLYVVWKGVALGSSTVLVLFQNTIFSQTSSSVTLQDGAFAPQALSTGLNKDLTLGIKDSLSLGDGTLKVTTTYSVLQLP